MGSASPLYLRRFLQSIAEMQCTRSSQQRTALNSCHQQQPTTTNNQQSTTTTTTTATRTTATATTTPTAARTTATGIHLQAHVAVARWETHPTRTHRKPKLEALHETPEVLEGEQSLHLPFEVAAVQYPEYSEACAPYPHLLGRAAPREPQHPFEGWRVWRCFPGGLKREVGSFKAEGSSSLRKNLGFRLRSEVGCRICRLTAASVLSRVGFAGWSVCVTRTRTCQHEIFKIPPSSFIGRRFHCWLVRPPVPNPPPQRPQTVQCKARSQDGKRLAASYLPACMPACVPAHHLCVPGHHELETPSSLLAASGLGFRATPITVVQPGTVAEDEVL